MYKRYLFITLFKWYILIGFYRSVCYNMSNFYLIMSVKMNELENITNINDIHGYLIENYSSFIFALNEELKLIEYAKTPKGQFTKIKKILNNKKFAYSDRISEIQLNDHFLTVFFNNCFGIDIEFFQDNYLRTKRLMLEQCKITNYRVKKENVNIRFNYNQIEFSLIEKSVNYNDYIAFLFLQNRQITETKPNPTFMFSMNNNKLEKDLLKSINLTELFMRTNNKDFLNFLFINNNNTIIKYLQSEIDLENLESDIFYELKCFDKLTININDYRL